MEAGDRRGTNLQRGVIIDEDTLAEDHLSCDRGHTASVTFK